MEHNNTTLKIDAKIILALLDFDNTNNFEHIFGNEIAFFVNDLKEVLEDNCTIEDINPIYVRCARYILQIEILYKRFVMPIYIIARKKLANCSPKDIQEEGLIVHSSPIACNEFYSLLLQLEDDHIREAINQIESNNKIELFSALYNAVQNNNYEQFKDALILYSGDFTNAAKYVRAIHAMTIIPYDFSTLLNSSTLETVNPNLVSYCIKEVKNHNNPFYIDYDLKQYNSESCKELGEKVSAINNSFKALIAEANEDPNFKKDLKKMISLDSWNYISLCFQELPETDINIFDEEDDYKGYTNELQKEVYFKGYNKEILHPGATPLKNIDTIEDEIEDEVVTVYYKHLKKRKIFCTETNIDKICKSYLAMRIVDGINKVEEIKYVFFGKGSRPTKKLIWKTEKQEIASFIHHMFKRKNKNIWLYFDKYIADTDNRPLFKDVVNPTSATTGEPYEKFKKDIRNIFEDNYQEARIDIGLD